MVICFFYLEAAHSFSYDGAQLRVFTADGQSVCQHDFSKISSDSNSSESPPSILCVSQFNKANLLVGLEDSNSKGILHLFNVTLSKILRSFDIPFGVSVDLISLYTVIFSVCFEWCISSGCECYTCGVYVTAYLYVCRNMPPGILRTENLSNT